MENFQDWLTVAIIGAYGAIVWWAVRYWVRSVNKKFDEVIIEIKKITESNIKLNEQIKSLAKRIDVIDKRMNNHAERIRIVEQKQIGCKNFKSK